MYVGGMSASEAERADEPGGTRSDEVVRVMTDDHGFRVIVCDTTETCRRILESQQATGDVARALADICTAAILVRETMAPSYRVQGILKVGAGLGSIIGDSFPEGNTRGLAQWRGGKQPFAYQAGSVLQMMRSLPNGSMHQGIVDIEGASGLSQALALYLQESEQVVSVTAVGALFDEPAGGGKDVSHVELRRAGGYVVQLLPEAERPTHMIMTERLSDLPEIGILLARHVATTAPDRKLVTELLDELLFGMSYTELGRADLSFGCTCSEAALLSALATLGRAEIQSMLDQGENLDITCDYCRKDYVIAIERLRPLVEAT